MAEDLITLNVAGEKQTSILGHIVNRKSDGFAAHKGLAPVDRESKYSSPAPDPGLL